MVCKKVMLGRAQIRTSNNFPHKFCCEIIVNYCARNTTQYAYCISCPIPQKQKNKKQFLRPSIEFT